MVLDLRGRAVLLVEDNPGDARLIAESLRDAGSQLRLITVDTLAAALSTLMSEKIDAVILDLGLPDSQGLDTFTQLQAAAPDVATLVLSGDSDNRTALSAVQEGAQDFLVKGHADGETLVRSIGYAIERKRAEAQVAESEEKFRYVFDRAAVGKSLTGLDGTIEPNDALCALLGYTREELADGATWQQITHPDDVAETRRQMDALLEGDQDSVRYEKRFVRKDGGIVWADLSSSLRRDKLGRPLSFMTVAVDITKRKRAEEDLRVSQAHLRHSLEVAESLAEFSRVLVAAHMSIEEVTALALGCALALTKSEQGYVSRIDATTRANVILAATSMMPDGLVSTDSGSMSSRHILPQAGRYPHLAGVSLNTARTFFTNSPAAEADSTGVPEGHLPLMSFLSVPVTTGAGLVGQIAVANAPYGYSDESASILERLASLYAVAVVNIEEHEALMRSEQDLHTAQATARIGSFVWDIDAGTWTSSETMDDIFGIDATYTRDFSGWLALVYADDQGKVAYHIMEEVIGKGHPFNLVYRLTRRNDGQTIWVRGQGALDKGPDGGQGRLLGVIQDITLQRAAEEEILESNESLQRMLREVAEVMGSIIETRDPYTQGHQVRVAGIAHSLAVEMGLSGDMLDCIQMAALLHDIGKLSVPAEILSKPGQLSAVEFGLIREHPLRGHDILSRISFPWPIADIVMQHHERCDGSGYPAGLTGDAILLPASVLAVADVLEAMASFRPYRPALGPEAAVAEIAGHPEKYCPEVVAATVSLYERGELGL